MTEPLSSQDLKTMKKAGKVAAGVLKKLKSFIKSGITTKDIELFFENEIKKYPDMDLAFKGFMGYPAACCVSVNEEIIHGIPSEKKINNGDLVSVDVGIKYKGLFVDTAYTYAVGRVSPLAERLLKVTQKSLQEAIKQIKSGKTIGDIGCIIQNIVEKNGFSVIRKFVGHGIGRELHMAPEVPNFGEKGQGKTLEEGFAIAVEPMVSAGNFEIEMKEDGWTAATKDKTLSAHFEHTIAITKKGPIVLTA